MQSEMILLGFLLTLFLGSFVVKDGDEWIFTVRKLDALPEHTAIVNYDGFAEGTISRQQLIDTYTIFTMP